MEHRKLCTYSNIHVKSRVIRPFSLKFNQLSTKICDLLQKFTSFNRKIGVFWLIEKYRYSVKSIPVFRYWQFRPNTGISVSVWYRYLTLVGRRLLFDELNAIARYSYFSLAIGNWVLFIFGILLLWNCYYDHKFHWWASIERRSLFNERTNALSLLMRGPWNEVAKSFNHRPFF